MHSKKYETVFTFYRRKVWSLQQVKNAVVKGWITEDEFKEITGEIYEAAETKTSWDD